MKRGLTFQPLQAPSYPGAACLEQF